jgi:hypothetical protein
VPVVGTLIGGIAGGIAGWWGGRKAADAIAGDWAAKKWGRGQAAAAPAADAAAQQPAEAPAAGAAPAFDMAEAEKFVSRRADITTIQEELKKRNLYKGEASGEWNADTNSAFSNLMHQVQAAGKADGKYKGDVNGDPGKPTRDCLEAQGADPKFIAAMKRLSQGGAFKEMYTLEEAPAAQSEAAVITRYWSQSQLSASQIEPKPETAPAKSGRQLAAKTTNNPAAPNKK